MTGHIRPNNRPNVAQPAINCPMTRDEVIAIARKAGLLDKVDLSEDYLIPAWAALEEIDKFAALVAAHARNRKWTQAHWTEYERSIAAAEREACAKLCEETTASWTQHLYNQGCVDCAASIRARGSSNAG